MSTITPATLSDLLKESMTSVICFAIRAIFVIDKQKFLDFNPLNDPDNKPENGVTVLGENDPKYWTIIYRFINDTVGHSFFEKYYNSDGQVLTSSTKYYYLGLPFEVGLPTFEEDQPPTVRCTMVNPGYDTIALLRQIMVKPTIELSVIAIRGINPNEEITVEVGPLELTVTSIEWDDAQIVFTLSYDYYYLVEPFMVYKFTPEYFPGLFSWK